MLDNPASQVYIPQSNKFQQELDYYDKLHSQKYRDKNQTKLQHADLLSERLSSDYTHKCKLYDILSNDRFLPAGRVQAAMGATEREVSPFNCSVSQQIKDSIDSIMAAQYNAVKILRLGTGIGYNFSHLRPTGALIKKLQTGSSGPLSFMKGFDVYAAAIASAGHRRGAQMGILNVDHPDIENFINAKMEKGAFTTFNFSVGITDTFMYAVDKDLDWELKFEGQVYTTIRAKYLWEKIINNAYLSAEPGIIFIDRLNDTNNLHYCEHIEATNPCSEQPLPPYGLCTLGSFNLVAYICEGRDGRIKFLHDNFKRDIPVIVEAYDNIFDVAKYAIPEHENEANNKRRIGLGLTGISNAIEFLLGKPCYGEDDFCGEFNYIAKTLAVESYMASTELAKKRGAFPYYNKDQYLSSKFIQSLPEEVQIAISDHGIRNSHLVSYAPCGTISQCAGNVSSGVEPVFYHSMVRDVHMKDGKEKVTINDFIYRHTGFKCKTLEECSIKDHMNVAEIAQRWCDSAVSKTVNVASNCPYEEYEQVYKDAHGLGLKGITVYRPSEIRGSVIVKAEENKPEPIGAPNVSEPAYISGQCANGVCTM